MLSRAVVLLLAALWLSAAATPKPDSASVTKRLAAAKSVALMLETDARQMTACARKGSGGSTGLAGKDQILHHINEARETAGELEEMRQIASPGQKAVLARVTPLLLDLARNTKSTLDHLDAGATGANAASSIDYVVAHEEIAKHLASSIVEAIDNPIARNASHSH